MAELPDRKERLRMPRVAMPEITLTEILSEEMPAASREATAFSNTGTRAFRARISCSAAASPADGCDSEAQSGSGLRIA